MWCALQWGKHAHICYAFTLILKKIKNVDRGNT